MRRTVLTAVLLATTALVAPVRAAVPATTTVAGFVDRHGHPLDADALARRGYRVRTGTAMNLPHAVFVWSSFSIAVAPPEAVTAWGYADQVGNPGNFAAFFRTPTTWGWCDHASFASVGDERDDTNGIRFAEITTGSGLSVSGVACGSYPPQLPLAEGAVSFAGGDAGNHTWRVLGPFAGTFSF